GPRGLLPGRFGARARGSARPVSLRWGRGRGRGRGPAPERTREDLPGRCRSEAGPGTNRKGCRAANRGPWAAGPSRRPPRPTPHPGAQTLLVTSPGGVGSAGSWVRSLGLASCPLHGTVGVVTPRREGPTEVSSSPRCLGRGTHGFCSSQRLWLRGLGHFQPALQGLKRDPPKKPLEYGMETAMHSRSQVCCRAAISVPVKCLHPCCPISHPPEDDLSRSYYLNEGRYSAY
uniref:Uncharacterized protein n=1 Tax=Mustela putorius furo TaxID=9669 RepID=M3Y873_MUSPF